MPCISASDSLFKRSFLTMASSDEKDSDESRNKSEISNPVPLNFKNYFNVDDFSDTEVKILNESGLVVGTLKAHKIVLCRNSVLKESLETNRSSDKILISDGTVSIVGNLDATKAFIKYLYTRQVDKKELNRELRQIATIFCDSDLAKACEENILKHLKDLSHSELVDEFLQALEYNRRYTVSDIAEYIAKHYSVLKHTKEFSKIMKDENAAQKVLDAFQNENKRMKWKLDKTSLQFKLKLSWTDITVHEFEESSGKWKFQVARIIKNNEDWLYFECIGNACDYYYVRHVDVTLLKNPDHGIDCNLEEETRSAKYSGATRFLKWSYVMDPKNGYIDNGSINIELRYKVLHAPPRKHTGGVAPRRRRASLKELAAKQFCNVQLTKLYMKDFSI